MLTIKLIILRFVLYLIPSIVIFVIFSVWLNINVFGGTIFTGFGIFIFSFFDDFLTKDLYFEERLRNRTMKQFWRAFILCALWLTLCIFIPSLKGTAVHFLGGVGLLVALQVYLPYKILRKR